MANSHYQTATTPRLYVSYPLFQYANGALDAVGIYQANNNNIEKNREDIYRMLQLDPSNFTAINPLLDITALTTRIVPESDNFTDLLKSNLWNFNYAMFLGHNFASAGVIPKVVIRNDNGNQSALPTTNIINHTPNSVPEYDGFSILELQGAGAADDYIFKL